MATIYGANLAAFTTPLLLSSPTNQSTAQFIAAVDDLADHGLDWVRAGLAEAEVLDYASCTNTTLAWQEARLAQFDITLAHVRARGMKLMLILGPPTFFTASTLYASTIVGAGSFTIENTFTALKLFPGQQVVIGDPVMSPGGQETLTVATVGPVVSVGGGHFAYTITTTGGATKAHTAGVPVAYTQADYLTLVSAYCSYLSNRYGPFVDVWQVWNEANLGDYRGRSIPLPYTPGDSVPSLPAAYLTEFAGAMAAARTAIRLHSAEAIATNVGETVATYDALAQAQFVTFFNAVNTSLDVVAVDMYDPMSTNVATKVGYLVTLQTTYGKSLIIPEFGMFGSPTDPFYTEAFQAATIPQQMAALALANPAAIILYRYQDPDANNELLGVIRADGSRKPAYDTFMSATLVAPSTSDDIAVAKNGRLVFKFYAPGQYPYPYGNASPVATIVGHISARVTRTQANRSDGHTIEFDDADRDLALGLEPFSTCVVEQRDPLGRTIGRVAWGRIDDPVQRISGTGEGTFTLEMPNITDEGRDVLTGIGYVNEGRLGDIVAELGALTQKGESLFVDPAHPYDAFGRAVTRVVEGAPTGWRASFLDDGTTTYAAAPVVWTPTAGAVANGNSLTRNTGGTVAFNGPGGAGEPGFAVANRPCTLQWQVVAPTTAIVGLSPAKGSTTVWYGFQTVGSTWQVISDGLLVAGVSGTYQPNAGFTVDIAWSGGAATAKFYVSSILVHTDTSAFAPFWPAALIATPGGVIDNMIFSGVVATPDLWWQVRYDKQTQTAALQQLAEDTGMYLRQKRDGYGQPLREWEFGPCGAAPTIRLIDGRGGDPDLMRRNPDIRLIDEIVEYHRGSVRDCVTVTTPLGAQTGDGNVDLELLWRTLNDGAYRYYNKYGVNTGSVFPEYTADVTIHRVASASRGYEYYCKYEPAFAAGGVGYREGGGGADTQFAYPSGASEDQRYVVQRALYKATVEQLRRSGSPHISLSLTTIGGFPPPSAGDLVAVDYTRSRRDAAGVWIPARIVGTFRVMKVETAFDGEEEPVDTWTLSNLGRYEDDGGAQADMARSMPAIQIIESTSSSTTVFVERGKLDAAHPFEIPWFNQHNLFGIQSCYVTVYPYAFQQVGKTAQSQEQDFPITIGETDFEIPASSDVRIDDSFDSDDTRLYLHIENRSGALGDPLSVQRDPTNTYDRIVEGNSSGRTFNIQISKTSGKQDPFTNVTTPIKKTLRSAGSTIAKIAKQTVIAIMPKHSHEIDLDMEDHELPKAIGIEIDGGSGVLVDRTASLIDLRSGATGPWSGIFRVECSRFLSAAGKDVRLRLWSLDDATTHGRGEVVVTVTIQWSHGGIGQLIRDSR